MLTSSYASEVVTTLPEFAWIVSKLAPKASVKSLLHGTEDPHFIDASPGFIFKVAKADVVIINGLELEVGWMPKVIVQSGNKKVQVNSKGYCDASEYVKKMNVLKNVDRSMGDVHSDGNPHYGLSPKRMMDVLRKINECLVHVYEDQKGLEANYKKLLQEFNSLDLELKQNSYNKNFYVLHSEFEYIVKDYKLNISNSLEKIPGVLPSASHLANMAKKSKTEKPDLVLASYTASAKILRKFQELSNIPYKKLRLHPLAGEDYLKFIRELYKNFL